MKVISFNLKLAALISCFFGISMTKTFAQGKKCGVISFLAPVPTPVDHTEGNLCYQHFEADAIFKSGELYTCNCCEFRQSVKGTCFKDGNKLNFKIKVPDPAASGPFGPEGPPVVDGSLDPGKFVEDYTLDLDRYGHRNGLTKTDQKYTKGGTGANSSLIDKDGCHYHMIDEPGFTACVPGHTYKIDLTFKDEIIHVCQGCDGCTSVEFNVKLEKTQPAVSGGGGGGGGGGIGPDSISIFVFIGLLLGWLAILAYRRRKATVS